MNNQDEDNFFDVILETPKQLIGGVSYTRLSDIEKRGFFLFPFVELFAYVNLLKEYDNGGNLTEIWIHQKDCIPVHFITKEQHDKKKEEKKRFTYLIKDMTNGYYKIGKSVNPIFREKTLRAEYPKIITIITTEQNIETKLHKKYKEYRLRGEWFDIPDSLITELKNEFNQPIM